MASSPVPVPISRIWCPAGWHVKLLNPVYGLHEPVDYCTWSYSVFEASSIGVISFFVGQHVQVQRVC